MHLVHDHPLQELNTFHFDVRARSFSRAESLEDLRAALAWAEGEHLPVLLLGGGSNLVLTGDVPGLVLQPALAGVELVRDSGSEVELRVGAGEDWPSLVERTLARGWFGLENLALIPGSAGAAPVQNIGAYGVELAEHLAWVEILERDSAELRRLEPRECELAYRCSAFQGRLRERAVITALGLRLSRTAPVRARAGGLAEELRRLGRADPSPTDVAEAVCRLRRSRLPDPAKLGNAGSFFHNPIVSPATIARLRAENPDLVAYPMPDDTTKLAAGWLIERCGFRGLRRGDAGVHAAHALVLVNYGRATGLQILALAEEIRAAVRARFGVELEIEPTVI